MFVNGKFCKDPKLAKADDFFFSGLNVPWNTDNKVGSNVTTVNVNNLPGLNTLGISLVRIDYAPYVEGQLLVGCVIQPRWKPPLHQAYLPGWCVCFPNRSDSLPIQPGTHPGCCLRWPQQPKRGSDHDREHCVRINASDRRGYPHQGLPSGQGRHWISSEAVLIMEQQLVTNSHKT